jgi:hypothetical protein
VVEFFRVPVRVWEKAGTTRRKRQARTALVEIRARSLAPLVKARGFGMTQSTGDFVYAEDRFRNLRADFKAWASGLRMG